MMATDNDVGQQVNLEPDLYKSVFESSPLPMWTYDLETRRFLTVNDAAVHKYGYARSEFLEMTMNDLKPSEDSDADGKRTESNALVKEWHGWRHRLKNGSIIEVDITTHGVKVNGRKAAFVIISPFQQKGLVEEIGEESEDNSRPLIKSNGAATILFEPEDGKITDANGAAASFYGYTQEKLCGLVLSEIISIEGSDEKSTLTEKLLNNPNSGIKTVHKLGSGESKEAAVRVTDMMVGEKRLGHLVILNDIPVPDVKENPHTGDRNFREIVELSPDGYYRRTADWKFVDVNSSFAAMLGYSKGQLIAGQLEEPVYLGKLEGDEAEAAKKETGADEIYRLRKKDGQEIWIEEHVRTICDGEGGKEFFEGFCRKVTIVPNEEPKVDRYENVFAGLSEIALLVRESDGKIVNANRAAEQAYGMSRGELLEKTIYDLRAVDSAETVRQQIFASYSGAQVFETVHRRKDGSIFPVETTLQKLALEGDDFIVSISRDTAKRKKSEALLKLSEEKYRTIFERSPFGILYFDVNGVVTDCNESLAVIMGSTKKSIIGLKLLELPSKELVSAVRNVLAGKLAEYRGDYESFTVKKTIHVRTTFTPLSSSGGRPSGGMAIFQDIAEQESADTALKESERRYRLLYEDSPVPYHLLDSDWKISDVNRRWVDLLGYQKNEVVGKDFDGFVALEQAAAFSESIRSFKDSGALGNLEADLLCKDGRRITVAVEAKLVRSGEGSIQQSQFMLYDITERRMAENALRESEQTFRSLAESASSAIFMYQKDRICYVNAACARITGYEREELIGMSFWEVVHPDFRDLVKELGVRRQKGESVPNHYELRIRTKSGESTWVDFTGATAQFNGELAVLGTVYDATERKIARRKLEESEEQHRILVEKSPDAIMILTDGKLAYLNPATLSSLRANSREQFLGKPLSEIFYPDAVKEMNVAVDKIQKSSKSIELKSLKLLRTDGSLFDADIVASPVVYLGKSSIQIIARHKSGHTSVAEGSPVNDIVLNLIPCAVVVTDVNYKVKWANPSFESLTGFSVSEAAGKNVFELAGSSEPSGGSLKEIRDSVRAGRTWHGETVSRRKNGSQYTEELTVTPVKDPNGKLTDVVFVKQDNTLSKSFEGQLLQAKKLEGIGQIVSVVVHDYNNILNVILGYGDLLKKNLKDQDPLRLSVDAILSATRRGAYLTKQLLDFEEEGIVLPKVVDVNKAIVAMDGTFHKVLGDDLRTEFTPVPGLWNAKIDPIHLYEILVNLAANARDAMNGKAGVIELKASNVMVDETFAQKHGGFNPGEYVMVSFTDSGKGIDESVMGRIFEPFVTTKHEKDAAGLGLAAVYGMVKRSGGGITVRSTSSEGTTFCIYIPRGDQENVEPAKVAVPVDDLNSDKTVLLVEDQVDLLTLVKQTLEGYGYRALAALGPEEALDICESYPEKIDILLSDVILPGINANELSQKIIGMRPDIRTLFMSGYSANALKPDGILEKDADFIQKPFTAEELARKLYDVLKPDEKEA